MNVNQIRFADYMKMAQENLELAKQLDAAKKEIARLKIVEQAYEGMKKAYEYKNRVELSAL